MEQKMNERQKAFLLGIAQKYNGKLREMQKDGRYNLNVRDGLDMRLDITLKEPCLIDGKVCYSIYAGRMIGESERYDEHAGSLIIDPKTGEISYDNWDIQRNCVLNHKRDCNCHQVIGEEFAKPMKEVLGEVNIAVVYEQKEKKKGFLSCLF